MKEAALRVITTSKDHSDDFLAHVAHSPGKQKPEELARAIVEEIVSTAPVWSATITSVIDYYLDDSRQEERSQLAKASDGLVLAGVKKALSMYYLILLTHHLKVYRSKPSIHCTPPSCP